MTLARLGLALLLLGAGPGAAAASAADGYRVIVHASNAATSVTREELSRIFLKKVTRWPDGRGIVAVDLFEDSPVRSRFSTEVHGRPAGSLRAYWQQKIYSGSGLPPITKPSDEAVAAFVQDTAGAIGYVSSTARVPHGTKVIKVVD